MRCLILGGGGFIGTNLCEALLRTENAVRVFERPNLRRQSVDPRIEWHDGDFANAEDVARALIGCDVVFDLIGSTDLKASNENPIFDVESNLVPTLRMLDAARRAGVRRIVFISSGGTVYGTPRYTPIPEDHPTEPLCSYGIVKLSSEKYLQLYQRIHGLQCTVLRVSNPYGEHQRLSATQGAVSVFLNRAVERRPIEIWGDGSVVRDFIYVGDLVRAMLACLDYRGQVPVFNIGSGVGVSLNGLLAAIEALLGHRVAREYVAGRVMDVPANILDTSLAARELGWRCETAFDEGLRRTWRWICEVRERGLPT